MRIFHFLKSILYARLSPATQNDLLGRPGFIVGAQHTFSEPGPYQSVVRHRICPETKVKESLGLPYFRFQNLRSKLTTDD